MDCMYHKPINPWTVGLDMITVHLYVGYFDVIMEQVRTTTNRLQS